MNGRTKIIGNTFLSAVNVLTKMPAVVMNRTSTVVATTAAVDPVTFDTVHVNQGNLYSVSTGVVTIASSGYYYVHVSIASPTGQVSDFDLAFSLTKS